MRQGRPATAGAHFRPGPADGRVHVFIAIVGADTHEVTFLADHVDQFELLEERGDRVKALVHLRPSLDGDVERRRVVEDEAHKRVADGPRHPVGHEEIEPCQVRQRDFAFLVAHREIVPAAIVEIAYAGDAHAVTVDVARGMTATSGRQSRSCEGRMRLQPTRNEPDTVPRRPSACAAGPSAQIAQMLERREDDREPDPQRRPGQGGEIDGSGWPRPRTRGQDKNKSGRP